MSNKGAGLRSLEQDTEALMARIRELETENRTVKTKLNVLEMRAQAAEPLGRPDPSSFHEFRIELHKDVRDSRSDAYVIDGVEFNPRVQRFTSNEKETTFHTYLYVKNKNITKEKFAFVTMEVGLRNEYYRNEFYKKSDTVSQHFSLCPKEEEEIGRRMVFKSTDAHARHSEMCVYVRITATVSTIEPMDDEDADTIVVVKDEEFRVSAKYLGMWSVFFKVYFRSEMREAQEGRYPISDDDIYPADFRELLMVISPTDKAITAENYYKLLKMARRFDMPQLTRRIEMFLIDFERNELDRAFVFRIATDFFSLKIVQSALLHRWQDMNLLQRELILTPEYDKLSAENKLLVNERFVKAFIKKDQTVDFNPPKASNRPNQGRSNDRPCTSSDYSAQNNAVADEDW